MSISRSVEELDTGRVGDRFQIVCDTGGLVPEFLEDLVTQAITQATNRFSAFEVTDVYYPLRNGRRVVLIEIVRVQGYGSQTQQNGVRLAVVFIPLMVFLTALVGAIGAGYVVYEVRKIGEGTDIGGAVGDVKSSVWGVVTLLGLGFAVYLYATLKP